MGVLDFLSEDSFSSSSQAASSAAASASAAAPAEPEGWHLVDKDESEGEESLNTGPPSSTSSARSASTQSRRSSIDCCSAPCTPRAEGEAVVADYEARKMPASTAQVYALLAARAGGAGRPRRGARPAAATSVVVRPSISMEDLESGFHLVGVGSPVSTA